MQTQSNQQKQVSGKPYEAPTIIYESDLEVRAGSPFGLPDPLDLTGTGK